MVPHHVWLWFRFLKSRSSFLLSPNSNAHLPIYTLTLLYGYLLNSLYYSSLFLSILLCLSHLLALLIPYKIYLACADERVQTTRISVSSLSLPFKRFVFVSAGSYSRFSFSLYETLYLYWNSLSDKHNATVASLCVHTAHTHSFSFSILKCIVFAYMPQNVSSQPATKTNTMLLYI